MTPGQVHPPITLHVRDLVWGRGGMAFHDGLDFSLRPGRCLLLRGPNGTGKTTLLLTLGGTVSPLDGDFEVEGAGDEPVLHYCGHRNAIKARLSVRENLDFWRAVNGATGTTPEEALEIVGLGALGTLDAGYLSAGQGRRLALARLLVSHRPLWLLDEPTAALDAEGHRLVGTLLDGHLAGGGMAVIATHDAIILSEPERLETLVLGVQA